MLTHSQEAFAQRVVRRKQLFKVLSIAGVLGAAAVIVYAALRRSHEPAFEIAPRMVIAVFILLNARQNLRQFRVASIFEGLGIAPAPEAAGPAAAPEPR